MSNKFDVNKLNSFLEMASQSISCDENCQRDKTGEELKKKYLRSQANLTLAEPIYQKAKRNYLTYVSGEDGYNKFMEKELNVKSNLFIKEFKENYNTEQNKIITQLETYNGLLINFRNIEELYKHYKTENKQLFKQLKEDVNDVLTNDRKSYYKDQQNESLNEFYYYIILFIYIIVVLCYAAFSFIFPSQVEVKKRVLYFILFLLLPFIFPILFANKLSMLNSIVKFILPLNKE